MAVPSPSPAPRDKAALRAEGLARRKGAAAALDTDTRRSLELALAERILPHIVTARVIAAYHPLKDEISPYPLLERLIGGQQAALPWFPGRDERMIWRAAPAVEPSPWGVLQPPAEAPALRPDLVLVPFVLADRRGTRIGHGKGHYDRALSHLQEGGEVFTIGIGWDEQLVEFDLPRDSWDMPLHAIATPREWVRCAG